MSVTIPTRRDVLAASAAAAAVSLIPATSAAATENLAVRPFSVGFPDEAIDDLRRRIAATRWPERELVSDAASRQIWSTPESAGPTQGVQASRLA